MTPAHPAAAAILAAHPASHPYWTMGATILAFSAYGFRPARVEGPMSRVVRAEMACGRTCRDLAAELHVSPGQVADASTGLDPMTPGEVRIAQALADCATYREAAVLAGVTTRSMQKMASTMRAKGWPVAAKERDHHRRTDRGQRSSVLSPVTIKARALLAAGVPQFKARRELQLNRSQIAGIAHRMRLEAKAAAESSHA